MSLRSNHEEPSGGPLPTGTLIVRPDHVIFPFSLAVEELEPARAVAVLGAMLAAVDGRLGPLSARVLLRGLRPTSFHGEGKTLEGSSRTALEGVIDMDLPPAPPADRALRVATMLGHLRALVVEGRKQRPPVVAAVGGYTAELRDPEKYRGDLVNRWKDRLREAVEAATAAGAPIAPLRIAALGPVRQRHLSLEQVELRIELTTND